ncbi:DNA repair protein RecN [Pseudohongiella spirulinae]|uniref:DNA repair protein RecN n=1 Tax=Pseudohongiella spirulinae TaxID=1249552 RepID=A0A0S2KFP0_9GAMM|nr:DNA repair protein RecN [Pseudohongiella spirulinae]ALO47133.1 recombination and repair protein [Pseudohongiella spirulinae]
MIQGLNSAKLLINDYNHIIMLTHLSISNYAIAEALKIEFSSGMTAITGETGAGKSIILGAMSLILGDRADRDVVRSGCERADISAEFDLSHLTAARHWLDENTLHGDDPAICLIRRSITADGRSRAWINGSQVTLQSLSALGALLMDIHSQHEHHSLLKKTTHQQLLDDFASISKQSERLAELSEQWRAARRKLTELQQLSDEQSAQQELARYQLEELQLLAVSTEELEQLDAELDQLTHAETRLASLQKLLLLCREDDEVNIIQMLQHSQQLLVDCDASATAFQDILELLNTALIQVEEAAGEINRRMDAIEINPERLSQVNERLSDIHQLARKHKVRPEQLPELQAQIEQQLQSLADNNDEIRLLEKNVDELNGQWLTLAKTVSAARRHAADKLTLAINEQLQALAMRDARLHIAFNATDAEKPQQFGLEQAEFLISTNAGQAAKPLARIASGGELSRISLAIQVITALTSDTPTLVFDEVDVGIGGDVAKTVGRLLKLLGQRSQILCVTHQPLVASQANQHLLVSKTAEDGATQSYINTLDAEQRLQEIARMLGGNSEKSLAHARELIAN